MPLLSASTSQQFVGPADIVPVPQATAKVWSGRRRRTGSTAVITSSPYKLQLLEAAAQKTPKASQTARGRPTPKKKIAPADTIESDSEDEHSLSLHTDSESEPEGSEMYNMSHDEYAVGEFVLVQFAKKRFVVYYAGKIVTLDKKNDEIRTQFLRRSDLQKGSPQFQWPTRKDLTWHDSEDIKLKLPHPVRVGGTARTAEKLMFEVDLSFYGTNIK